jgi:HAD superfamily hydrolase (TIGR01509 family)
MSGGVEAILFDLSEVYLYGLKGTNELLSARLDTVIGEDAFLNGNITRLFHGELTEEEYFSGLIATNSWEIDVDALKKMVRSNFRPIEGMDTLVKKLKSEGYRLGLLSVHAREWVEYCEDRFKHHEDFDVTVYSFQVGISKPDSAAYEHALEALEATPAQTIFIDDSMVNVRAARQLGMRALAFESARSLQVQLIALGVLPAPSSDQTY